MKEYSIDVGTWESGTVHKLYARSPEDAYDKANKLFVGVPGISGDIVQIHEIVDKRRKCVYDYMNGFELYQGRDDEPGEILQ